eukprot:CAMPEP_0194577292 /NCGR_PEP_ID=MMETSP0292-20121207/12131_1 /TAXON_ID=39354 /ORGANISM="Heterosigma akashiwo, Strain CCMP2393" /LENGTH=90 /DNA_ID=CAMNT_0039429643 /DNA_START=551 /DNA_END=820 /DNA_ORIENTATION=-
MPSSARATTDPSAGHVAAPPSIGIRLYFLSVPLFIWLFSRWALLGATVLHLTVIYQLERAWFLEELVKETLPGLLTSRNEEDGEEGKWKD